MLLSINNYKSFELVYKARKQASEKVAQQPPRINWHCTSQNIIEIFEKNFYFLMKYKIKKKFFFSKNQKKF